MEKNRDSIWGTGNIILEIYFSSKIEKNVEFVTQFNDQQRIVLSTRKAHGKHVYNLLVQYFGESYSKKTKKKKERKLPNMVTRIYTKEIEIL